MGIHISFVLEEDLTSEQKKQIVTLNQESFGDVSPEEAEENFIAKPYARLFAYDDNKAVGTVQLFKRENEFAGRKFLLGGIGGVCVTRTYRRQGIGTQMLEKAVEVLKKEGCEIACLNTEPTENAFPLYERIGFRLMKRDISFENSKGQIVHDYGTMFVPLDSDELFDTIMQSTETFHYGVGYW